MPKTPTSREFIYVVDFYQHIYQYFTMLRTLVLAAAVALAQVCNYP